MTELKVGMPVFIKTVNNQARHGTKVIEGYVITKIKRKYLEVEKEGNLPITFVIESREQKTDYSPDYILYTSKQEIVDEEEKHKLYRKMNDLFGAYGSSNLSLDQLRRIDKIISE